MPSVRPDPRNGALYGAKWRGKKAAQGAIAPYLSPPKGGLKEMAQANGAPVAGKWRANGANGAAGNGAGVAQ